MATAATNTKISGKVDAAAPARSREDALDTTVRLVTPERIVFRYPLAGPFRRFCAYLIDLGLWLFLVIAATIISLILSLGSMSGMGLALVAYFVLTWGYGATCE